MKSENIFWRIAESKIALPSAPSWKKYSAAVPRVGISVMTVLLKRFETDSISSFTSAKGSSGGLTPCSTCSVLPVPNYRSEELVGLWARSLIQRSVSLTSEIPGKGPCCVDVLQTPCAWELPPL